MISRRDNRIKRHKRVRAKIYGTKSRPRLSVFKSHKHIHLQLIDDEKSTTIVAASTKDIEWKTPKKNVAAAVAKLLAEKAKGAGVTEVVFDRGGYIYHGRIEAVGKALRETRLKI